MSHHHKARRTKHYRPRGIDTNPIELAINQAMRLLLAEQTALTQPMEAAFAEIRAGRGNLEHWARLAGCLNIATALAHLNIANDHHATFEAGQQALSCLHERVAATGVRVCLPGLLGRPEQMKAELVASPLVNLSGENGERRFFAIGVDGQRVAPTLDEGDLKRRLKGYITEGKAADGVADAHA